MNNNDEKLNACSIYVFNRNLIFVARNTNPQAHCLALPSAPLSTLVTGLVTQLMHNNIDKR
jgi:hypothetical protein